VRNITERRQTAIALKQKEAELAHVMRVSTMGEMATGLAHELNQPLAAISNYCYVGELALTDAGSTDTKQLRGLFQKLTDQAIRAGKIIRRLREFVGKSNSVRSLIDLNEVVEQMILMFESEFNQSDVCLELKLDPAIGAGLVDEIQIQQVLVNLTRNALDAMSNTERDKRTLKITTSATAEDFIEIAVCDTGEGISTESAEKVFDAFFTTKSDGMGMGLPISRTIIESYGGRMSMTPNSDRGVTFHFTVPTAKAGIDDDTDFATN